MFKASFLKLILGVAILVICYAFPFFMMPIGSYTHEEKGVSAEFSFKWNGEFKGEMEGLSQEAYYDLDGRDIYFSLVDKDVSTKTDLNKLAKVKSLYKIQDGDTEYVNGWGVGVAVVGYVLTAWGLLGLVLRKKR